MEIMKKRERSANFDKREVRLLTAIVAKYRSIIENKKTDAATNKVKAAAWCKIANLFNAISNGESQRSAKTLKLKYEGMKKQTKKKISLYRTNLIKQLHKTEGDPLTAPDLDDVEEKVVGLSSNICGLDARADNETITDQLYKARLKLVELQMEIARKNHGHAKEEHDLRMLHLQNDERRKQELHELTIRKM